jgi:hypothetical protein
MKRMRLTDRDVADAIANYEELLNHMKIFGEVYQGVKIRVVFGEYALYRVAQDGYREVERNMPGLTTKLGEGFHTKREAVIALRVASDVLLQLHRQGCVVTPLVQRHRNPLDPDPIREKKLEPECCVIKPLVQISCHCLLDGRCTNDH